MRVKLTNMLSIFADSLGQQASRFEPVVGHGCSPKANLIFPACLGKCLVSNKSSLRTSCEEFKHSKSFVARAQLLQIQIGADCLCRSHAVATKAHRFRLVRLRMMPLSRVGAQLPKFPVNLSPVLSIDGESFSLQPHLSAPVVASSLRYPAMNLQRHASDIAAAIDAVVCGV